MTFDRNRQGRPWLVLAGMLLGLAAAPAQAEPIRVGVWEAFDWPVLRERAWKNAEERFNGKDDDGNGFVDDVRGIAFDVNEQVTVDTFWPDWDGADRYDHGTAVGSLIVDHAPDAEILPVGFVPTSQRLKESGLLDLPVAERLAGLAAEYEGMQRFVDTSLKWMSLHGVRIVNLSWGLDLDRVAEVNLNFADDDAGRREVAAQWLDHFAEALQAGLSRYPEMIFVTASGNHGRDVEAAADVPARLNLDNLVVVGGLNQQSEIATDSARGEAITVYAPAENIDYRGARYLLRRGSGNSLAAPLVSAWILNHAIDLPPAAIKARLKSLGRLSLADIKSPDTDTTEIKP